MKNHIIKIVTTCAAVMLLIVLSPAIHADVIHDFTDGSTFAGGTYGDFAQAGSPAGVNITSASADSGDGAFESLGQTPYAMTAALSITLFANQANTATDVNVLLLDQDNGGGDGEAYLYNVDLTGLGGAPTTIDLGSLANWTSMNPDTFGHGMGDGILNFEAAPDGLYEWQIQGSFANPGGNLDIVVQRLEITPIPEPGSLAVLGLGALGLVVRRRRS